MATLISIDPDAEQHIVYMARVSSNDQNNPDIIGLLNYCIKHGHWSIFEMENMTVEITTSRAISAQILRHRSFSFQEFSQRYQKLDGKQNIIYNARRQDSKNRQNSIDDLPADIQIEWLKKQEEVWDNAYANYEWALENGIAKECARMVLPMSSKTKIYMNGTIRSWIHYIQLRTANGTQEEHRKIAEEIKQIFILHLPNISTALGWK